MAVIPGGGGSIATEVRVYQNAGAPVDGTTFAGIIPKGGLLVDTTTPNLYINTGTQAAPVFKLIAHA